MVQLTEKEVAVIGDWNGLKCSSCGKWIPITEYDQPLDVECCNNPDFNQHQTPVVSLEEIQGKISVKRTKTESK